MYYRWDVEITSRRSLCMKCIVRNHCSGLCGWRAVVQALPVDSASTQQDSATASSTFDKRDRRVWCRHHTQFNTKHSSLFRLLSDFPRLPWLASIKTVGVDEVWATVPVRSMRLSWVYRLQTKWGWRIKKLLSGPISWGKRHTIKTPDGVKPNRNSWRVNNPTASVTRPNVHFITILWH